MIAETARTAADRARNALRFLSVEVRGLQAAASVLAMSALLSSLLALVRDRLLAHSFGASTTLDIYYAAFRVPDLIFVATGALVSVYMIIPELAKRSDTSQRDYIDTVVSGFSLLAVFVCAVAALFAPLIVHALFPQLVAHGHGEIVVAMTRIMLLQPILLGLSNILAAITQAKYRYALYSLSPLLYNIGIILGVAVFYPMLGIRGLAWGVIVGAALHVLIQLPSAYSDGFFRRLPRLREPSALWSTVVISLPRALSLSMNQITFIGLTALAGYLAPGSIAVFMFAFNLQAVPLAVIGASYSVAAFPTLAASIAKGEMEEFISLISTAARYVLFWSLPASALIIVLRAHIVRVILGSGAFDWTDTRLTAAAFALFSLSLVAQGIMLLLVRGYYAAGRTFVPFLISLGTLLLTLFMGALSIFVFKVDIVGPLIERMLRVQDLPGTAVLGLPFVYAFVTIIACITLVLHFEYRFGGFMHRTIRAVIESLFAAVSAGAGAYVFLFFISPFIVPSTSVSIFMQGFTAGVFGIIIAMFAYFAAGSQELREVFAASRARIWRRAPEEGTLVASAEEHSTL
jgi:putative peptidoglycan lipid II flippase